MRSKLTHISIAVLCWTIRGVIRLISILSRLFKARTPSHVPVHFVFMCHTWLVQWIKLLISWLFICRAFNLFCRAFNLFCCACRAGSIKANFLTIFVFVVITDMDILNTTVPPSTNLTTNSTLNTTTEAQTTATANFYSNLVLESLMTSLATEIQTVIEASIEVEGN